MEKMQKNGFHLIFCPEKLKEVIHFLENGYGWKTEKSVKLIQHLRKQTPEFPAAAVFIDKGEIAIGVLLFAQGYHKDQMKNVINFSNWYAKENHRGIEAVRFAKNVTTALDEFIITCYTPMEAVCKILKLMKYKNMHVRKVMVGLSKSFPFIQFKFPLTLLTFKNYLIKPKNMENRENRESRENRENRENREGSVESRDWLYKVHKVKKHGLPCSLLSLVNHGETSKINIFWLLMMIIRYGIVRINLYIRTDEEPAVDVWLMKNCGNECFVSPMGSELVV
jgi:hypothetical protein